MLDLKLRRSRGVRVTLRVSHWIERGNRARNRHDWAGAADAYTKALKDDPGLGHIWVQLGHALKEQGHTTDGLAAYRRASELSPTEPDPHLQLGHFATLRGDRPAAVRHFLTALHHDPEDAEAAAALHYIIVTARGRTRSQLVELIRSTSGEIGSQLGDVEPGSAATLFFDVSDLVEYWSHSRLPTGIQRVQIQTIAHALASLDDVRLCCVIDDRNDWLEVPSDLFQDLAARSIESGEPTESAWIRALHRFGLRLRLAAPVLFPLGATLVSLGALWQLPNHFLFVRHAKATRGIRYVPFVHDLIAIVAPQHFTRDAKCNMVSWVLGIFDHADYFLANSEATKRDILRVSASLGQPVDPDTIAVIRLDADSRPTGVAPLPRSALAMWHLECRPFVLLVSTVEPRKGHITAFAAWRSLIDRHGPERVATLVCIGKRGWSSEAVYARLEHDPALASRVICSREYPTPSSRCYTAIACSHCSPVCTRAGACRSPRRSVTANRSSRRTPLRCLKPAGRSPSTCRRPMPPRWHRRRRR